MSGPGHIAITEGVDGRATTLNACYDVITFDEVPLDQRCGHGRLVQVVDDVRLLLVEGLLLADVDLAFAWPHHGLIHLVLEVHSVPVDPLGPRTLR